MLKYLRIAVTTLSLTVCILLIALWVRSHQHCEYFTHIRSGNRLMIFGSNLGAAYFLKKTFPNRFSPPLTLGWKYSVTAVNPPLSSYKNDLPAGETLILVPYWLSIAAVAAAGCGPWIRWSSRFSLRTLLIATTLVAVSLGTLAVIN
jgi:hypothetical protein